MFLFSFLPLQWMDCDAPRLTAILPPDNRGPKPDQRFQVTVAVVRVLLLVQPGHVQGVGLRAGPEEHSGHGVHGQVVRLESGLLGALEETVQEGSVGEGALDRDLGGVSALGAVVNPVDQLVNLQHREYIEWNQTSQTDYVKMS